MEEDELLWRPIKREPPKEKEVQEHTIMTVHITASNIDDT